MDADIITAFYRLGLVSQYLRDENDSRKADELDLIVADLIKALENYR